MPGMAYKRLVKIMKDQQIKMKSWLALGWKRNPTIFDNQYSVSTHDTQGAHSNYCITHTT